MDNLVEIKSKDVMLEYALAFKDIDNELSQIYKDYANSEGQVDFDEYKKYRRMIKTNEAMEKVIRRTILESNKVTRVLLRDIIKETYRNSIDIVNEEKRWNLKGIQKDIDITKTLNRKVKGYNWTERMGINRSEAITRVQKTVKDSLESGDVYNVAAKKLSDELGTSMNKSLQIVRTESHRCLNESKQQSFNYLRSEGANIRKKWVTARDGRVRGTDPEDKTNHVSMDNVTVGINEEFTLPDGTKTMQPGMSGDAAHDVNCRCITVLEIGE